MNAAAEEGARGDLALLVERLRRAGLRVDTRQYLAAHELLLAFAQRGVDLQADADAFASHLGPIFCTSVEDQRLFEGEFRSWWGVPTPPPLPAEPFEKLPGKHRWASTTAIVLVALLVMLGAIFYALRHVPVPEPATGPEPSPVVQQPNTSAAQPASRIHIGEAERVSQGQFPTAQQSRVSSPWLIALGGGALCALTVFGIIWFVQRRRRTVALKRLPDTGDPEHVSISPPVADFVDLTPAQLLRIATGMRRARAQASVSLSLEATVEMTARAGGFVSPAFAPRLATSEYLVLIERRGAEDHMHHLAQRWIEQLRGHDVAADSFDFHTDPRVCTDAATLRRYRLPDLLVRYHRAVVLIHAETATLFDEITGQPQRWLEPLLAMTACVLLTPSPTYRWSSREKTLIAAGVVVLPATPAGLQIVASMGSEWRQPSDWPARYARDFPRVITNRDTRWLDRNAPPPAIIATLLQQVSGFLGPLGYLWVCACAVYPQISWATTLALLPDIVAPADELGRRRAIEECLPSLARLPWFRAGYMPDWLRSLLIANLPPEKEAAVRERFGRMVLDLVRKRDGAAKPAAGALDIAKSLTALDIARAAPDGSPLGDRVFMGFLAGANPDPLTLTLPAAARAHGPRTRQVSEKLVGHWHAFTQLQPAMARSSAAVVAGVLSALALWKIAPTANVPIPLEANDVSHLFVAGNDVKAAIAPNGGFLAISANGARQGALLWDLQASRALATLAPAEAIAALAVSPDSRMIATLNDSLRVKVWDASGKTIADAAVPNGSLPSGSLSFNRDGSLLAVGAGAYVSIFDLRKKEFVTTYSAAPLNNVSQVAQQSQQADRVPVTGLDFGMQPSLLAIAYQDHVSVMKVSEPSAQISGAAPREAYFPIGDQGGSVPPIAMSADGQHVATVESAVTRALENFRALAWEWRGSEFVAVDNGEPLLRSREAATFLGWSPRGEVLVHGQADGRLRMIDVRRRSSEANADASVLFDGNSQGGQTAVYRIRFTSAQDATNTSYVIERHSLRIDPEPPPPAAAPAAAPAPAQNSAPPPITQQTPSVILQRNSFILPLDGHVPTSSNFPMKSCCSGSVAELRDRDSNRVVGYVNLTYDEIGQGTLASRLQVTLYMQRPGSTDFDTAEATFTVNDYLKNSSRVVSGTVGGQRFSVTIEKARIEKSESNSKADYAAPGAYFDVQALAVRVTVGEAPRASRSKSRA